MNNGLGPQFMSSCMLNHLDLIIMPLNSKNKDSCTRKVQMLRPRPWRTSNQAFINLHCQSKSKPLGDSLSTLAGPNSGVTFTNVVEERSIICQHNWKRFIGRLFNHPLICKVCVFVFLFVPFETSTPKKVKHPAPKLASIILFFQHFTVDVEPLMCHVHLQIAISLHHLAWYNIPAAHCMFQLQVRHGIGPAFHVDIWQFSEKYDDKPWPVKHLGPAKCRSPKCKHRLATPPLAQCKWKNVCDRPVAGHKSTSKRTQCILKNLHKETPGA